MQRTIFMIFILLFPLFCLSSWSYMTLNMLSRTEKIAQLIIARVNSTDEYDALGTLIMQYGVGGIIPLQAWSLEAHQLLMEHMPMGKVPLFISEDAEWGCAMRIPELPAFPKAMTLGAIPLEQRALVYEVGYAIGMQCRALGIHINCAPVVDINSNPANPVIGMRSCGDTAVKVIDTALHYAQGLWDAGVLPCLKHFPGHGDTICDSHVGLPIIMVGQEYLWQHDMLPFQKICTKVPCAIMIGHMAMPLLEIDNSVIPASLSSTIVKAILSQQIDFNGLIISDALDMCALSSYGDSGELALMALKAGIDILLCPADIEAVINYIDHAIETGEYSQKELDEHLLKVLTVKEQLGVFFRKGGEIARPVDLYEDLIQKAYDAAATSGNDFASMLPFENYETVYECVTMGNPIQHVFPEYVMKTNRKPLLIYLYPGGYKTHRLSLTMQESLREIVQHNPGSIVLLFGSPYCLRDIPFDLPTLVLYEDVPYTHSTVHKVLSGQLSPHGCLPIEF